MSFARRDFLKVVGGASVAGALGGIGATTETASAAVPAFGFKDDTVPMNAANEVIATSPDIT